jgi:hypothetical protein
MAYKRLRAVYEPNRIRAIFILESPPQSGKFFYNPDGTTKEPLFAAMMELIGFSPSDKAHGLSEFCDRGLIIVDASYKPVNAFREGAARNAQILLEYPSLVEDLNKLNPNKAIPLILIKANICRLLESPLRDQGFVIANAGIVIPFPSHGQQPRFRQQIALVLAKAGITTKQKMAI